MLAAGATVGSLLAAPTSDYMGRKYSSFLWCGVFLLGAALQMVAKYEVLLVGRMIGGLGVGASSVLAPQFLSENAPKSIRGMMTSTYNLMIVIALMLAFWVNYAVSKWDKPDLYLDNSQWRVAMGIQIAPAFFTWSLIPFLNESPRYLVNKGETEKGLAALTKLRQLPASHPYVQTEYQEMRAQVQQEQEIFAGRNYWIILKDIFTRKANFRRFFLAIMLFLFHKFTGTDSLNVWFSQPSLLVSL